MRVYLVWDEKDNSMFPGQRIDSVWLDPEKAQSHCDALNSPRRGHCFKVYVEPADVKGLS